MLAYRIADGRRPVFDGTGALLHGGRWNSPGRAVIYAAESYAAAMLEVLVHANLSILPKTHVCIEIDIPASLSVEKIHAADIAGWPQPAETACRALGDAWLRGLSCAVLLVPSIVTAGHEQNLLINPVHPDFGRIKASAPVPVPWDTRLFGAAR